MSLAYADYLQSPQWRELRGLARERADGHCELCGGEPSHVHHVRYPKCYKDDNLDNLLVLCKTCHARSHGIKGVLMPNHEMQMITFEGIDCPFRMYNGKPYWELVGLLHCIGAFQSERAKGYRQTGMPEGRANNHTIACMERFLPPEDKLTISEPVGDNRTVQKTYVTQEGLFEITLELKDLPKAKKFRYWVTHEVLPDIQRTGSYSMTGVEPGKDLSSEQMEALLRGAADNLRDIRAHDKRLERHSEKLEYLESRVIKVQEATAQDAAVREQLMVTLNQRLGEITEGWVVGHMRCQQLKRDGRWSGGAITTELCKSLGQAVADLCRRDGIHLPEKVQYGGYLVNQYPQKYWDAECARRGYIH